MTLHATFTCETCGGPVEVALQVPAGTTLAKGADDLAAVDLEAHVMHDLEVHLDEVPA